MIPALIVFALTYVLMLAFQAWRPWIALSSAAIFIVMGYLGLFDMGLLSALGAVDYNVLMMIAATMGLVSLFIDSRMPARLAELMMTKTPNVMWAVTALAVFAGVISAFVDNVATVLMVAPVGVAISRKLNISPVPVLIAIAVSSNLQGAATMVGDTTSMLLGGFAGMNFMNFFWMLGKPGIFWGVELGALASAFVLMFLFRHDKAPISAKVETEVKDFFPELSHDSHGAAADNRLLPPRPGGPLPPGGVQSAQRPELHAAVPGGSGESLREGERRPAPEDGAQRAGQGDAAAALRPVHGHRGHTLRRHYRRCGGHLLRPGGNSPFLLYTLIVAVSVLLSAFIDNIPYVATMLPVVQGIAALMGAEPYAFYFGLLTGATLGGNLTPIGASANITAIGILRKTGRRSPPGTSCV
ncbi:MAG: SLC13 family permease [Oscillospiraceae bacterium]